MNGIIHLLQPNVANRIAAGEVVERPQSVVKELVENSIDAGANVITVEIENGGIDCVRVMDNGCGMSFDDCRTAFLRHATSKIAESEDIRHIETLGFRGEALASIASVAEVTIKTRQAGAEEGTLYRIDNGEEKEHTAVACTEGTSFTVKNLFSKVPARLKFLKSSRSEAGLIGDFISRMILCYPNISFHFINNEKTVYKTYGENDLKQAVNSVYGTDVTNHLLELAYDDGYMSLNGFIGSEDIARPNRNYQSLFVNERYVRDFRISNAVLRAYDTRLLVGKFPFYILNMKISPYEIDINVHPQKMEVRFAEEQRVTNAVYAAVFKALNRPGPIDRQTNDESDNNISISKYTASDIFPQKHGFSLPGFFAAKNPGKENASPATCVYESFSAYDAKEGMIHSSFLPGLDQISETRSDRNDDPSLSERNDKLEQSSIPRYTIHSSDSNQSTLWEKEQENNVFPDSFRYVGNCFSGFLMIEHNDDLFIIDQHAAHERLLFEKFIGNTMRVDSQRLLIPSSFSCSPADFELLLQSSDTFKRLGFDIEADERSYSVRINAVPVIDGNLVSEDFVITAINAIRENVDVEPMLLIRSTIIQSACKHAVKITESLSDSEIGSLLDAFKTGEIPLTCPHGRPVLIRISRHELEKMFKRIV